MLGYAIAQVKVCNPEEYKKYLLGFIDAFRPFNGRVLVATDEMEILE
jgi:uncharacterized protein (DUF1330 family)